jgi:hypothetical protein
MYLLSSDPWAALWCCAFFLSCFFIFLLLYLQSVEFRRRRELERDNYRLIRRLGSYHSLSIGTSSDDLLPPSRTRSEPEAVLDRPESYVPPAFRMRKPKPPIA